MFWCGLVVLFFGVTKLSKGQYLNESCQLQSKTEGICKLISECPSVEQDIRKGIRPSLCGFQRSTPVICCPIQKQLLAIQSNIGTRSKEKCEEYKKKVRRPQLGIINGLPSTAGEFPHMVALGFGEENSIEWLCGGTLVSEKFVLTAAHCVNSPSSGPVKFALVGTINLKEHEKGGHPQVFSIVNASRHPDFKPPSTYNDIALLELNYTATITPYVVPACINTELNVTKGQAIGWGRLEFTGSTSDHLMKVDLRVYEHTVCNRSYSNIAKRLLQTGIIRESQICAGGEYNESKDTCQGDSGGPLHMETDRRKVYTVIGVTSFGKGCGIVNIPGVYTRVSHFVPWIESIIWR